MRVLLRFPNEGEQLHEYEVQKIVIEERCNIEVNEDHNLVITEIEDED